MDKHLIFKILFALVVICVEKCKSDKLIQINYLWQARHWNEMTWFNKLINTPVNRNTHMDLLKNQLWTLPDLWVVSKLKIIILLMECGYGKQLIDFLWIATYTVTECRELTEDGQDYARDCWLKLEDSLKKGALTMFKLSRTYDQIIKLDRRLNNTNPFYGTLSLIHGFLMEPHANVQNGLTALEAAIVYQDIKDFAKSLGKHWDGTCYPKHSIVSQEELQNEYEDQPRTGDDTAIPILCDFYTNKMNYSIDFITGHLHSLGYRYSPNTHKATFSVFKLNTANGSLEN